MLNAFQGDMYIALLSFISNLSECVQFITNVIRKMSKEINGLLRETRESIVHMFCNVNLTGIADCPT